MFERAVELHCAGRAQAGWSGSAVERARRESKAWAEAVQAADGRHKPARDKRWKITCVLVQFALLFAVQANKEAAPGGEQADEQAG